MNTASNIHEFNINEFLELLSQCSEDDLPDPQSKLGQTTRDLFHNNWENALSGLLAKTNRIRVEPEPVPAPRMFRFEMDLPYKRKTSADAVVELVPGPIRGKIIYRPDVLANLSLVGVAVRMDETPHLYHPNYSRRHRMLCIGGLPPGPFPLDQLLENHLYPILSYQNRNASDPADAEAADYFANDPNAMVGLESVAPLY